MVVSPSIAVADRGAPCEADSCDVDPGPRPWILSDDCRETTDVVGYRQCGAFGQWAATAREPELVLDLGVGLRNAVIHPIDRPSIAARGTVGPSSTESVIATSIIRVTGGARGFYAGLELELGDLTGRVFKYGALVQSGAVVGAKLPLGPLDIGGELFVAARNLKRPVDDDHTALASVTDPVIEVRARVELWLSPWLTLDGALGAGVLEASEWVISVNIGLHTRAFGGER